MAAHDYHFLTGWRIRADPDEVCDVIGDPLALPRWWPDVYLSAREVEPGDPDGAGRVVALHTRGWLPYTLRWSFQVTEVDRPRRFAIRAWGDFEGTGVWTFRADGEWTGVEFAWSIRAQKPLLRWLSFLLRPAFAANHEWAMRRGRERLQQELERRRAGLPPPG